MHCISIFIINKDELRESKIDSIIEDKELPDIKWVELPQNILATTYIPNIKKFGKNKTIGRISTDYFGGFGHQSAKLFVNNEKVFDFSSEFVGHKFKSSPINGMLKILGIVKNEGKDEFDSINLGNYRCNEDF